MGDQPVTRPLPSQNSTNTEQKQTDMQLRVEFEPTIPMFEQVKIFLVCEFSANAIGF
jgi:hypothetical protein